MFKKFILSLWEEFTRKSKITLVNSKTKLQEFSLKKFKELPTYVFYKKTGPQHKPFFKTDVQIPNSKKIIGTGTSKKAHNKMQHGKVIKNIKYMNWEDECYLLSKKSLGENANIINVFTKTRGKLVELSMVEIQEK